MVPLRGRIVLKPAYQPLEIFKGAVFSACFKRLNPDKSAMDLTGRRYRMQIRSAFDDNATLYSTLDTTDSSIVLDAVNGKITPTMTGLTTGAFTFVNAVYDLAEMDTSGNIDVLVRGPIKVIGRATVFPS